MTTEIATRPRCRECGAPAEKLSTTNGKTFYRSLCWKCRPRTEAYLNRQRPDRHVMATAARIVANSGRDIYCCSLCERTFPFRCDMHHVDEERGNSSADNLSVLCPNCHRLMH